MIKEKLCSGTLEKMRSACEKFKDLPVLDETNEDEEEEEGEEVVHDLVHTKEDGDEGVPLPSVPCPTVNFVKRSGGVSDVKLRQVLYWLLDAPTDAEVLVRLEWLATTYPTLRSFCDYLQGVRKYWSRWSKTWETTFGYQSTQGIEGWHWSIKAPLRGKIVFLHELLDHLLDIYLKRRSENRYIKKIYLGTSPVASVQKRQQDKSCFVNLIGGGTADHSNIKRAQEVFNEAGILLAYVHCTHVHCT